MQKGRSAERAALGLPQGMFCVPSLRATVLNKEHKSLSIPEFVLPL